MSYRILLLPALLLGLFLPLAAQKLHRYPVVGVTSATATFRIWYETGGATTIRLAADAAFSGPNRTVTATAPPNGVLDTTVNGLLPASRYYYRIEDNAGAPISPVFSFKTFPEEGKDAPATILFGSCQQSHSADSGKTFEMAANLGGDLFIQLGDWGYHDDLIPGYPAAPGTIEQSYELRLDTAYPFARRILSQMGLAYVWDDHDWVTNNSDGAIDPALKSDLLRAYRRHIPHYPLPNPENGIWQSFRVGNVEFFMIDDRAQRNPVDSAFVGGAFSPRAGHSMLAGYTISGVDQRRWLLDAIRSSTARWKVLVSQVFFNPSTAPFINLALLAGRADLAHEFADKWIGYPADLDSLRNVLRQGYGRNFLIICGDAHTNLYDDGTHSVVPEFMVGNLDKENSNLYATLKSYGFDVWTAGQTESASTVGRITIETTPRHRMIVESFDEKGSVVLRYEMVDTSGASSVDEGAPGAWSITGASLGGDGMLRLSMANPPAGMGSIELYDLAGHAVATGRTRLGGAVELPAAAPHGSYVGRVSCGGMVREFRVIRED